MTDTLCPVCQKSDRVKVLSLTLQGGTDFGVWRCGRCRHIWRTEPWKVSNQITYYEASPPTAKVMEALSNKTVKVFEKFLQLADKLKSNPTRLMVDFGCSCGTAMLMFKKHGWDVLGIELLPSAQKVLDERNLPWASSMKDSGLALRSVDIVVMSDCIYYLADPVGTLREIRSYMRPNGMLFLRHPTRAGLFYVSLKIMRKKVQSFPWGSHVHLFSRKSAELTLKQAGFANMKFLKEEGYERPLRTKIIHQLMRAADFISLGLLGLTLSWTVIAKE